MSTMLRSAHSLAQRVAQVQLINTKEGPNEEHRADYRASNWLMAHKRARVSVHDLLGSVNEVECRFNQEVVEELQDGPDVE
jgi:hypothetical protein